MQRRELFRLLGAGAVLPVFDSNVSGHVSGRAA